MANVSQNFLIPSGIEYAYEATSFLLTLRHIGQWAVLSATRYVKAHAWVVLGPAFCAGLHPIHLSVLLPALYFYNWLAGPLYPEASRARRGDGFDGITR